MSNQAPRGAARKRFGQHFLVDRAVIEAIVAAVDPREDGGPALVEIGPGRAALTDALLDRVSRLYAIELDRDLVRWLGQRHPPDRLELIAADVLTVDFEALAARLGPLRLVGNLPYNISTPLLVQLVPVRAAIIDGHFMLQKEVVDRIVAGPGSAAYGRLGILLQNYFDCESLFDVPPTAFVPPPKVVSSVIRMLPRLPDPADPPPSLAVLERLLEQAFSQRRKMLRKTLLPWLAGQGVEAPMLSPTDRPEDVPVAVYRALAHALDQHAPGGAVAPRAGTVAEAHDGLPLAPDP